MLPLFLANQIITNHDIAYRNRTLARRTHDRGRATTHSRSTARQYSRSRAHQTVSQLQQHSAKSFREPLQDPARSGASRSLPRKSFISLYQNATGRLQQGEPMSDSSNQLNFSQALETAVRTPGAIMEAYSAFHNFSIGNQLLALIQCRARGIQSGPIKTFKGWQARLSCACRSRSNIKGPRQNQAG